MSVGFVEGFIKLGLVLEFTLVLFISTIKSCQIGRI